MLAGTTSTGRPLWMPARGRSGGTSGCPPVRAEDHQIEGAHVIGGAGEISCSPPRLTSTKTVLKRDPGLCLRRWQAPRRPPRHVRRGPARHLRRRPGWAPDISAKSLVRRVPSRAARRTAIARRAAVRARYRDGRRCSREPWSLRSFPLSACSCGPLCSMLRRSDCQCLRIVEPRVTGRMFSYSNNDRISNVRRKDDVSPRRGQALQQRDQRLRPPGRGSPRDCSGAPVRPLAASRSSPPGLGQHDRVAAPIGGRVGTGEPAARARRAWRRNWDVECRAPPRFPTCLAAGIVADHQGARNIASA